jgi:hypothetical protein
MGEANSNTIPELRGAAFGRVDRAPRIDNKGRLNGPNRSFSGGAAGFPMKFQVDDVIAALILSLFMFRRLEVLTIRPEDNTHLPAEKLSEWRSYILTAYTVGAIACALKVVLNQSWYWLSQGRPAWMIAAGGLAIFVGWVIALVWCWRRTTEANAIRVELQIQRRPPPPKRA